MQEFIDITRHKPETFDTSVASRNISGYVGIDLLERSLGDENLVEYDYLICGSPSMTKGLKSQLLANGVVSTKIHHEDFSVLLEYYRANNAQKYYMESEK